jgi:hypothetical protein
MQIVINATPGCKKNKIKLSREALSALRQYPELVNEYDRDFFGARADLLEHFRMIDNKIVTFKDSDPKARIHPAFVNLVLEMGDAVNCPGSHDDLRVIEIPDDVEWEIAAEDHTGEYIREIRREWHYNGKRKK